MIQIRGIRLNGKYQGKLGDRGLSILEVNIIEGFRTVYRSPTSHALGREPNLMKNIESR